MSDYGVDTKNWPHKFTKHGKEVQFGEEKVPGSNNLIQPIYAIPMICVCCHKEFMQNKDPIPPGPCPARTERSELKRILNS